MKKNVITFGIIIVALTFVGMILLKGNTNSNNAVSENDSKSNKVEEKLNKSNMEKLTKEAFLEKVFNFEQNKEWKYEGDLPCVIDFYADWCGPCKMVHPILEELSKEYDGKIRIYQIDTEAEQELAAAFGIKSIPSMLFCPAEGQPQMAQGALPKASLKKAIEEILLSEKAAEVN
jgi:thioredoxin 1